MVETDDLISVEEAADILGISRSSMYRLVNEKRVTHRKRVGMHTKVSRQSVLYYAAGAVVEAEEL